MAREEGSENERPQDDEFSAARRAEAMLPPTQATIDELGRLITTNIKKGETLRMWSAQLAVDDETVIDIDRILTKHDADKYDTYTVTFPNGTSYEFSGRLDDYQDIKDLREEDQTTGLDTHDRRILETLEYHDGLVTVGEEERPMNDDDWRSMAAFLTAALNKPLKDYDDMPAMRKKLAKALKHYVRDTGDYTANTKFEGIGERLGLLVLSFPPDDPGLRMDLRVIHDVDEPDSQHATRTIYDIAEVGDERTIGTWTYQHDKQAQKGNPKSTYQALAEEDELGLHQPTESDFRAAITLINTFAESM